MSYSIDSIKNDNTVMLKNASYMRYASGNKDSLVYLWGNNRAAEPQTLFDKLADNDKRDVLAAARNSIEMIRNDNNFRANTVQDEELKLRRHQTEWHRKFTLSFACLVFFFIGAPLGAIIRKGGIGMPAVISVVLFIFYYIIDNVGFKLAKEGVWPAWQGMWLSSSILFVLGTFLTYKATNDSAVLNVDTYLLAIKEWLGRRGARDIERKTFAIERLNYRVYEKEVAQFDALCHSYMEERKRLSNYFVFWRNEEMRSGKREKELIAGMESIVERGTLSDKNLLLAKLMDYPQILPAKQGFILPPWAAMAMALCFPLGLLGYFSVGYQHRLFVQDMKVTLHVNEELMKIVTDIESDE
jgi:lipopolysaccharide export system permease protein